MSQSVLTNVDIIDTVNVYTRNGDSVSLNITLKVDKSDSMKKLFVGQKYSNIEALRRFAKNLSGQQNVRIGLYIWTGQDDRN